MDAGRGTGLGAESDAAASDPDPQWTEYSEWVDRMVAAGRDPEPEVWVSEDDEPIDPLELEGDFSASGPTAGRMLFVQHGAADLLPPGPVLVGLTDNVVTDVTVLSDDELIGLLQVSRRQVAHEQYKQVLATAEFARRRQEAFSDAARLGVPVSCRPGGFPGDELAIEMVTTLIDAGHKIDDAIDLTSRLPRTLAGMAAGLIDAERAGWIAFYTRSLSPADLAYADELLAEAAPDLRVEQLARKAAALEKKLNPAAVKARRERARRSYQRVEVRPELSGNASLSGREMDTADVLASKAHIDAIAIKLRRGGMPGSLGSLRVLAMTDLTQGRDPLGRLEAAPAATSSANDGGLGSADHHGPGSRHDDSPGDGHNAGADNRHDDDQGKSPDHDNGKDRGQDHGKSPDHDQGKRRDEPASQGPPNRPVGKPGAQPSGPFRPGGPASLPALINIIIPVGTLLGSSTAPAQAGGWGLLDHEEARTVAEAAAAHPRTRWCATVTAPDGTALAHACAAGQHPRLLNDLHPGNLDDPHGRQGNPGNSQSRPPANPPDTPPGTPQSPPPRSQPPPSGHVGELVQRLDLTFTPIARGSCDHEQAETRYTPSRNLRHLVRARSATCDAPGCTAEALHADLDHTRPWPDGSTDQCNLAPRCRRHHQAKQSPDWTVEQTAPGVTRWILPSGRTHTTTPTQYDT